MAEHQLAETNKSAVSQFRNLSSKSVEAILVSKCHWRQINTREVVMWDWTQEAVMSTRSFREDKGAEEEKYTQRPWEADEQRFFFYQFASVHGLLEPLAELGARSHHRPQHVSGGQVANTVLLRQPRGLRREERDHSCEILNDQRFKLSEPNRQMNKKFGSGFQLCSTHWRCQRANHLHCWLVKAWEKCDCFSFEAKEFSAAEIINLIIATQPHWI